MRPRLYLETSVVSYLAARPSRDLIVAAQQELTREWWERRAADFDLYCSQLVIAEAMQGDAEAAARRIALLDPLPLVELTDAASDLAAAIQLAARLPAAAAVDALHVALAATGGMDFLLTWNCRHIANAELTTTIEQTCRARGLPCPRLCTPAELMGM